MVAVQETATKLQPNPYRAALVQARERIVRVRAQVVDAVARPRRTLANAWQCPAANALDAGLHARDRDVLGSVDDAIALLGAKIGAEPDLIPPDDWRHGWRAHVQSAPADPRR
ncbi:MAG TPA: hypothetical protein VGR21_05185 [Cryptosporangiaceae bacterium]|nr:hypothetical protein [Cryptosporangiaceae bacterium]